MTPKQKRNEIKRLLAKLTDQNRNIFMKIYSPREPDKDINLVVDDLPAKKINWALTQTQNTYHRIFKILKAS